jgi:hypothetical protein
MIQGVENTVLKNNQRYFSDQQSLIESNCCNISENQIKVKTACRAEDYRLVKISFQYIEKVWLLVKGVEIHISGGYWVFEHKKVLDSADLVYLFYGQSRRIGAVANCKGNKDKDHFRRLGYRRDLLFGHRGFPQFKEINTKFCDENILRSFKEEPLLLREFGKA